MSGVSAITGEQLLSNVVQLARSLPVRDRWMAHHQRPGRTAAGGWTSAIVGDVGFPDLVLSRRGELIVAECKGARETFRPGQVEWLGSLATGGAEVYVWRPVDWPQIEERLRRPVIAATIHQTGGQRGLA